VLCNGIRSKEAETTQQLCKKLPPIKTLCVIIAKKQWRNTNIKAISRIFEKKKQLEEIDIADKFNIIIVKTKKIDRTQNY
jgi:hypothetical protein